MFYNTTNETGETLKEYRSKAKTQDELILEFYKRGGFWSPSQVQENVLPNAPLTSVRRSISNLTADGYLLKTIVKVKGIYDRPEYCWRINKELF